jgi:hypothetical protein
MDVVDELKEAVTAARASRKQADDDHERVKELILRVRQEQGSKFGPADIETLTDKYFDRGTISRMTAPALGGKDAPRKDTRKRPAAKP